MNRRNIIKWANLIESKMYPIWKWGLCEIKPIRMEIDMFSSNRKYMETCRIHTCNLTSICREFYKTLKFEDYYRTEPTSTDLSILENHGLLSSTLKKYTEHFTSLVLIQTISLIPRFSFISYCTRKISYWYWSSLSNKRYKEAARWKYVAEKLVTCG